MLIFDIVVIGASSAGLFAAEILAKQGKKVAVFEQSESIAPDARTYIITPGLFRIMPDINPDLIRHETGSFQIEAGSKQVDLRLNTPDLIVERTEFIGDLLTRAQIAGVEVFTGSKFLSIDSQQEKTQLIILYQGIETSVTTEFLIAADGVNSQVRLSANMKKISAVPLLQADINLPENWDADVTKVWFDVADTPYFYWLIPDQNRKAVVGLIAEPGENIRKLLDDFLKKHHYQPLSYQTGLAALHNYSAKVETKIGNIKVLFVGDAAGHVKVTTVGGTVTGLYGGKAAAESILTGQSYRKSLKVVQRELNLHQFIRMLLERMSAQDYEKMVSLITPSVLNFLSKHNRDSMRAHFWKLPFLQPGFIPLGLKLLFG